MRIMNGIPKVEGLDERYQWRSIEPLVDRSRKSFGIVNNLISIFIVISLFVILKPDSVEMPFLPLLLCIVGLFATVIVVHELLHVIWLPGGIHSKKVCLSFCRLNQFIPAVGITYQGEISKRRMIPYILTPFIVMTVLPTIAILIFHLQSSFLCYVVIFNSIACLGDIETFIEIMVTIPKNSILYRDYWREA